ncbi:MAG: LacI family DNA-binding transcriptional regulator [Imperialibacter sp.]|uniref:LacI family DNA-binding transcriptional regulator n=1 Tax=Imperialibacter sp. TaxID=2038411 RepID=UPI0032ED804E
MENKNIRIKDIARLAGVSVGTVDRVLHKRGKVSDKALEKVHAILDQIDYKPNLIARSLGLNRTFRVAAVLPDPKLDAFWVQSHEGLQQSEREWQQQGLVIDYYFYDLHNKESYNKAFENAIASSPDGAVVAPLFYKEALPFFEKFHKNEVPYILFNTHIEHPHPLSFIGQDLYQSGRLAAELISPGLASGKKLAILHIHEDLPNSAHLLDKEKGFREYVASMSGLSVEVNTINLEAPENPSFEADLKKLFSDPQLHGVYISTSKAYQVVEFMKATGKNGCRIVGYDLLEKNLQFLKEGYINFLINQNPSKQAALSISHLINYLVFKTTPPKEALLPLEIITKENIDSYKPALAAL